MPVIVEVIALFPGARSKEVERQVTIPLEVTFSGMPGLEENQQQVALWARRPEDDLALRQRVTTIRGGKR